MEQEKPSKDRLVQLLDEAYAALEASQAHWGAVYFLTGDRRYQRQQQEVLKLIRAMRRRVLR